MGRNWIRRTNLEDLLDDGIENHSDLKASRNSGDSHPLQDTTPDLEAIEIRRATLERIRIENEQQARIQHQYSYSRLGLLLGGALSISGLLVVLYAQEGYVLHTRIRYLPSVVEHVTRDGARFYGIVVLLFGIVLCWYATHRPKVDKNR